MNRVGVELLNNTSANAASRDASPPAPTLYFGARLNTVRWVVVTGQNSRTDRRGGTRRFERDVDVPAPTVTGQARSWRVEDRVDDGQA